MTFRFSALLWRTLTAGAACLQIACASPAPARKAARSAPRPASPAQHGVASVYTDSRTASGERFNHQALTAAHRTLPMGSKVRVTNLRNDRSVVVRINDRGPFTKGRVIDLTPAAASQIGLTSRQGITRVKLERL